MEMRAHISCYYTTNTSVVRNIIGADLVRLSFTKCHLINSAATLLQSVHQLIHYIVRMPQTFCIRNPSFSLGDLQSEILTFYTRKLQAIKRNEKCRIMCVLWQNQIIGVSSLMFENP